jgi:hypothetical protein
MPVRSLLTSSRSKSGYKYVIHDSRSKARAKPWSVNYKGYRSAGFATPREAAIHVAAKIQIAIKSNKQTTAMQLKAVATGGTITKAAAPVDAWMSKPNIRFDVAGCDLFGRRITVNGRRAVIKSWSPCAQAAFGIVFDDQPNTVFMEDLCRKGRSDWQLVEWEDDDIWETQDIRPMCPQCGHPLGVGSAAWTKCTPCGHMEPGAASTEVLKRARCGDPFRRP